MKSPGVSNVERKNLKPSVFVLSAVPGVGGGGRVERDARMRGGSEEAKSCE